MNYWKELGKELTSSEQPSGKTFDRLINVIERLFHKTETMVSTFPLSYLIFDF